MRLVWAWYYLTVLSPYQACHWYNTGIASGHTSLLWSSMPRIFRAWYKTWFGKDLCLHKNFGVTLPQFLRLGICRDLSYNSFTGDLPDSSYPVNLTVMCVLHLHFVCLHTFLLGFYSERFDPKYLIFLKDQSKHGYCHVWAFYLRLFVHLLLLLIWVIRTALLMAGGAHVSDLSHNALVGPFPGGLGSLQNLQALWVFSPACTSSWQVNSMWSPRMLINCAKYLLLFLGFNTAVAISNWDFCRI